jgi:hypothetical protein
VKEALFDDFATPWAVCRPPRRNLSNNLSATVAMILMEPERGVMEVAPLPALNRQFTTYTLDMAAAARKSSRSASHRQGRMMHKHQGIAAFTTMAMSAGVALALAWTSATPALAGGGVLRARFNADIRSTDPGTNRDANTDGVMGHVVEGLVAFREDTSIGPMLADSWEISPDDKTYTFQLRKGVKFHNGAVMTADDVVWSFKRWLDPATQWRCLSEFSDTGITKILGVEATDPQTVVIRLERPTALLLGTLARPDCGQTAILHRDSLTPEGKWREPVATGPFKLGEWKRGQYVDLIRFDDYVSRTEPRDGYTGAKKVEVDKVRVNIIPDSSAAKAGLLSGSLDIINSLSVPEVEELKSHTDVKAQHYAGARPHRHPVAEQRFLAQGRPHPPRAGALARHQGNCRCGDAGHLRAPTTPRCLSAARSTAPLKSKATPRISRRPRSCSPRPATRASRSR